MKKTNMKALKGIKRFYVGMTAAAMMITSAAAVSASADAKDINTEVLTTGVTAAAEQYHGHDIISGTYHRDDPEAIP